MKTVKALVRAHLRKTGRQRGTKEAQIIRRIESHVEAIIADVMALSQHTKNRIAAHKAHHTMKKRQLNRKGAKDAKETE